MKLKIAKTGNCEYAYTIYKDAHKIKIFYWSPYEVVSRIEIPEWLFDEMRLSLESGSCPLCGTNKEEKK